MKILLNKKKIIINSIAILLAVIFSSSFAHASTYSSSSNFSSSSSSSYSYSVVSVSTSVNVCVCTTCSEPEPTCSMNLDPTAISNGESSVLSWTSTNTTSVSIDQGIGNVSVNGSETVSPSSSTTYTGTFTGLGGVKTCSVMINVDTPPSPPACSMALDKTSISGNEKAVLSWSSSNVTSVSIDQGIGDVSVTGSSDVFPTTNTTYTGTFIGPDGTVSCNASIEVVNDPDEPSCSLGISPSVLSPGQSATLYWSSANIGTTTINNNIGLVNNSGAISISPSHNMSYTGTFEGENKTITCSVTVTLGGGGGENPPTVSLSSNTFGTEPSYIYLSQIPYTGVPEFAVYLFRIIFFGGLLYSYYRIDRNKLVSE